MQKWGCAALSDVCNGESSCIEVKGRRKRAADAGALEAVVAALHAAGSPAGERGATVGLRVRVRLQCTSACPRSVCSLV